MDQKTYEYMVERVRKHEVLTQRVNTLTDTVERLKTATKVSLNINGMYYTIPTNSKDVIIPFLEQEIAVVEKKIEEI